MKMNYRLKNDRRKNVPFKLILVVVVFFLLLISAFIFPNVSRALARGIANPFWSGESYAINAAVKVKEFFRNKNVLLNENTELQNENAALKLKEADYDILVQENADIKAELGRPAKSNRIIGRVISKPPRSPYDIFVLDVGATEGIAEGDKAYLGGNVILGLITSVTSHTSLVTLFGRAGQKVEAQNHRTAASFELTGAGGANLTLQVPKDTDILWGDTFIYPGLNQAVIGNVYYIDTNSQSSFKTVYIRQAQNVFTAEWVFVEKNL